MSTFHEDCCAWVVGGKMMRTKSNDPINDRVVDLARDEANLIMLSDHIRGDADAQTDLLDHHRHMHGKVGQP